MAHYAIIGSDNIVKQVVRFYDSPDWSAEPVDEEQAITGILNWNSLLKNPLQMQAGDYIKKTSYNDNLRKRYAGQGFSYNAQYDAFIPPQAYPSWTLDIPTLDWVAPVPYPTDGAVYIWSEPARSWVAR